MIKVYVSLGSNIDRYRHITAALNALQSRYGVLDISPIYESEAVGFEGDCFLNLVVGFQTRETIGQLTSVFKQIEDAHGRERGGERFSARTLDLDLLLYADRVGVHDGVILPRDEILHNAFVLLPLADLEPGLLHPVVQKTYAELWSVYDKKQKLWPVDFDWQGKRISCAAP